MADIIDIVIQAVDDTKDAFAQVQGSLDRTGKTVQTFGSILSSQFAAASKVMATAMADANASLSGMDASLKAVSASSATAVDYLDRLDGGMLGLNVAAAESRLQLEGIGISSAQSAAQLANVAANMRQLVDVLGATAPAASGASAGVSGMNQRVEQTSPAVAAAHEGLNRLGEAMSRVGELGRMAGEGIGRLREMASGAIEPLRGLGESIRRTLEFAAGYAEFDLFAHAVEGLKKLGEGAIQANASAETLHQTLTALYNSSGEADQAFNYMTKFAVTAPFTRQSILQAGVAVASFGQDITQVLTPLGNIAAVMGTDMVTASRAFNDALAGRFAMMKNDLHITKEELQSLGAEIDNTGHVTNVQSLVTAFEKLGNTRFKDGMSLQMTTFNGQMSNLEDQFQNFERLLGRDIFAALKTHLFELITWLNGHQQDVANFANAAGQIFAEMGQKVFEAARFMLAVLPPALTIAGNLWRDFSAGVRDAIALIRPPVDAFLSWLSGSAFPVIDTILTTAVGWWRAHSAQIRAVLATIAGYIQTAVNWLTGTAFPLIGAALSTVASWWNRHQQDVGRVMAVLQGYLAKLAEYYATQWANVFDVLRGVAETGWGLVQIVFGTAYAVLTGDWDKFQGYFNDGINSIMAGLVNLVAGAMGIVATLAADLVGYGAELFVPLANGLITVANDILHSLRGIYDNAFVPFVSLLAGLAAVAFTPFLDGVALMANGIMSILQAIFKNLPTTLVSALHLPGADAINAANAAIMGYKALPLMTPGDAFGKAQAGMAATLTENRPKVFLGADQQLVAGVSVAQAQADIEKKRHEILDPVLADLEARRKQILAQYGLDQPGGHGAVDQAAGVAGEAVSTLQKQGSVLDGFKAWLDSLTRGGIHIQNVKLDSLSTMPGAGGLPVFGAGDFTDPKAAAAALRQAVKDAFDALSTDLKSAATGGNVPVAQLLTDLQTYVAAERAAKESPAFIAKSLADGLGGIVAAERERFRFDLSHGATQDQLLQDMKDIATAERAAGERAAAVGAEQLTYLKQLYAKPLHDAQLQFSYDRVAGGLETLIADIRGILSIETAMGTDARQLRLDTNKLFGQLISTEVSRFEADRKQRADQTTLTTDMQDVLKAMAAAGDSQKAIDAERNKLLKEMGQPTGSAGGAAPTFRGAAPDLGFLQASFGQTTVIVPGQVNTRGGGGTTPQEQLVTKADQQISIQERMVSLLERIATVGEHQETGSQAAQSTPRLALSGARGEVRGTGNYASRRG